MTWPSPEVAERLLDAVVDIVAAYPRQWSASAMADHFLDVIRPDVDALVAAAERRGRVAALREAADYGDTISHDGWLVRRVNTSWLRARADEEQRP